MPPLLRHAAAVRAAKTLVLTLVASAGMVGAVTVVLVAHRAVGSKPGALRAESSAVPALAAAAPVRAPVVAAPRAPGPGGRAVARRAADGHFYFDVTVGSTAVPMVFDTGAGMVVLRAEDAVLAGIPVDALAYTVAIGTANGTTDAAPVVLDTLRVGGITRRNVPAWVLREGKLGVSLLGQSFMSKLASYRFENGELILRGE